MSDSLTLLAFRFSGAKPYVRVGGVLFLIVGFLSVWAATYTPLFIREVMGANLPDNPTAETAREVQRFISAYLELYTTGDMELFVSIAVALLLGSIVFVPFSGYVIHGVVSHSEMVIVKNGESYKIGDSLLFQVISSFTIIQLVGITVVAELLTFSQPYPAYTVVFVWDVWVVVTIFTAFFSWVVEYMTRKFGKRMRFLFLAVFVLAILLAVLVDENHGTTLFGLSQLVFDFLTQLASGDQVLLAASLLILTGIGVAGVYLLTFIASQALRLPEPATVSTNNQKQVSTSASPTLHPTVLFFKLLFRYNTITKPVFTAVGFSLILILLLRGTNALTTTMIVLPLAVGVSFGANIYGLVSGSVNWLLSIEHWRSKMVYSATTVVFVSVLAVYAAAYGAGTLLGAVSWAELADAIPAVIAITFSTTVLSMYLSSKNPLPFSGRARENLISSPTALMGYVFLYLVVVGTVGNVALYVPTDMGWMIAGGTAVISILLYIRLVYRWLTTEQYTQKLLQETINAG